MARHIERLFEQIETLRQERDDWRTKSEIVRVENRSLREQLEMLRMALEVAYHYYPKGTPMSESIQDVLDAVKWPDGDEVGHPTC